VIDSVGNPRLRSAAFAAAKSIGVRPRPLFTFVSSPKIATFANITKGISAASDNATDALPDPFGVA
jgi:hypothetical protein